MEMGKRFKKTRKNEKEQDAVVTAIKQSNLKAVQNIINEVGLDFSKLWLGGYALLCTAIKYRQFEIATWLTTKDCKIDHVSDEDTSDTPLHLASFYNNIFLVETLMKKGACVTAKNFYGETALHVSCRRKNLMITRVLLNDDTIADIPDNCLTTPLHIAVEEGCLETIKLLLSHKVNINARTIKPGYQGFTALHIAIVRENYEVSKILLENGADIEALIGILHIDGIVNDDFEEHVNYQNYKPLHLAIEVKNYDLVNLLLNHKADVNATLEHNGYTPLHIAMKNNDDNIVILLSEWAVNFDARTKDGKTVLHVALENDWRELLGALVFNPGELDDQTYEGETLLLIAVEMGDEAWVELLLDFNPNINLANNQKQTPLHIAAEFSEEIVKMLLASGANVDEIDVHNDTALSIAVKHCEMNIIKEILHHNPSVHNIGNKSALAYATKNINENYIEIIHLLIDYGFVLADEDVIDIDLLYSLILQGQLDLLMHILVHGANVVANMKKHKESVFVHKAVRNEDVEMVKLLITYEFDLNILDSYGKSAIDYAIELDNIDILNLLLENGAKINNFPLSLLLSTKNRNLSLFEKLLNYQNDVNVKDKFGTTPLHLATWNEDYEFVQLLLNERACINTTDGCFNEIVTKDITEETDFYLKEFKKQIFTSPLHIAVGKKDRDICKMFLECHANVNSRDGFGRTPLHIAAAVKSPHQKIVFKTLFEYGADVNALDEFKRLPIYYLYNHSCVCSIAFQNQYCLYQECECDLYEENEVNDAIATFVKQIVLLHSMNKNICEENYNIIESNDFSKNLLVSCLIEISRMKEKKLCDHISFHDILSRNKNSLAAYARNEELSQAFETSNYTMEFPLYCDIIKEQFDRARNRNNLLERAIFSFGNLTKFTLPQPIVENIFDFFLFNDLRMVIGTCNIENIEW